MLPYCCITTLDNEQVQLLHCAGTSCTIYLAVTADVARVLRAKSFNDSNCILIHQSHEDSHASIALAADISAMLAPP